MPIEIIQVSEVHAEALHACLESVGREKKFLAHVGALPLECIVGLVRESVANNTARYVALDGTAVVGWCDVIPAPGEAVKHRGAVSLGVLATYRGHGLARKLMTAALEHAMRSGITRVELEVRADNWSAIELYRSMDFVQECIVRNGMCFDGQYFDVLVWARSLLPQTAKNIRKTAAKHSAQSRHQTAK